MDSDPSNLDFEKLMIKSPPNCPIEWKNQGNKEFILQKYEKAIRSYTEGLKLFDDPEGDTVVHVQVMCDMLSNRAAAYLALECFETGLADVERLLKIDPNHFKGMYRKGKALLGLQRFQEAIELSKLSSNLKILTCENRELFTELLELAKNLLRQQKTGEFDIVKLYMAGDVRHGDCADFVGPVKVQEISGCGRGLVATQHIQPGQLISATKAFQIVFPAQEQGPCPGVPLSDVFHQRIVYGIVQKLTLEPNLCRTFYQLYAGMDFPPFDADKDPLVVDEKRISAISRHNSFVGNMPDFENITRSAEEPQKSLGIWILPSFINHRCWDVNAIWTTFGDMLFVRALKEIPSGEEILISYVDATQLYEEREKLFNLHGFVCECRLCETDRDHSKEGIRRMELLRKIQKEKMKIYAGTENQLGMELMMKELWNLDKRGLKPNLKLNPSLIDPLFHLGFFYFRAKNFKKSLEFYTKCHSLTTNSSFQLLAVTTCFHIIPFHLSKREFTDAKEWTKTVKKEMMTLYGTLDVAKLIAKTTLHVMEKFNIFLE